MIQRRPDGTTLIVCGRPTTEDCAYPGCTRLGSQLCDYPVANDQTCDTRTCQRHCTRVASETDYCWRHGT